MIKELLKELLKEELGQCDGPNVSMFWVIGKSYHIRTVTMDFAGTLKAISDNELVLSDASWIADSGRFNEYLKDTSKVSENEPYKNDVCVNRQAITDATEIDKQFTEVK